MEDDNVVSFNSISIKFGKIYYNLLGDVEGNLGINENRFVSVEKIGFDSIILKSEINITLDPPLFSLDVSCLIELMIDHDETSAIFKTDFSALEKHIEEKKYIIVNNTAAWDNMTLVIAEITSKFGGYPLLPSPMYIPD